MAEIPLNEASCQLAVQYNAGSGQMQVTLASYGSGYGQFPSSLAAGDFFRVQAGSIVFKVTAVNSGTNVWSVTALGGREGVDANVAAGTPVKDVISAATITDLQAGMVTDATTTAIGGVEVLAPPHTGHPTARALASPPSRDTTGATDTTNLQADVNALSARGGGTLHLWPNSYYTTGLTVPSGVSVEGEGPQITNVYCPSATATAISVTGNPVMLQKLSVINNAGTTPTAGAGIAFSSTGAAQQARIVDVWVQGFYIDMDVQYGQDWFMERCRIENPVLYGLKIQNLDNADGGDMGIVNCYFAAGNAAASSALIRYESGGGLRLSTCKFNGSAGAYNIGIDLALADGAVTQDMLLANCSFENYVNDGIKVHLAGPSNTGTFANIVIIGDEFSSGTGIGVTIAPEASGKVSNVFLGSNAFIFCPTAYSLSNVDLVTLAPSTYKFVTTPLSIGSGVTNLTSASGAAATMATLGLVEVDNNSGGTPVAVTVAGYLSSLVNLTHSNFSASAGILLSQLGQSGASVGQVPQWNGAAWVPATPTVSGGTDHLHGLARWVADGSTTAYTLPDIPEYMQAVFDNGSAVDDATVSLSSDLTQLIFATAPTAGHVLQAEYVTGRI